ncbi:MAG TPA: hypothetical protein VG733_01040 [Chthoniobacteraceae bacterium]|nr:hypothetical protein [Chthoniobacteraceae bacterium]
MALFVIIFLMVTMVLVGVGFAFGLLAGALAFVLVSLGVVSSSVVVGIRRRSAQAGVRTFLLLCGALGGVPAGMFCAWFGVSFLQAAGDDAKILVYGGLSGAVGGVLVALLFDYILRNSANGIAGLFKNLRARKAALPGGGKA